MPPFPEKGTPFGWSTAHLGKSAQSGNFGSQQQFEVGAIFGAAGGGFVDEECVPSKEMRGDARECAGRAGCPCFWEGNACDFGGDVAEWGADADEDALGRFGEGDFGGVDEGREERLDVGVGGSEDIEIAGGARDAVMGESAGTDDEVGNWVKGAENLRPVGRHNSS